MHQCQEESGIKAKSEKEVIDKTVRCIIERKKKRREHVYIDNSDERGERAVTGKGKTKGIRHDI